MRPLPEKRFEMFELDLAELVFQITFSAGFDDTPVKMEILAGRMNCHLRTKFDNRPFQGIGDSGFGMR